MNIVRLSAKIVQMICTVTSFALLFSCSEMDVKSPKTGNAVLDLHNFNSPIGEVPSGYVPNMHYFFQNDDGTYNLTLSGLPDWWNFATDWYSEYVLVSMDQKGTLQSFKEIKYPTTSGTMAHFGYSSLDGYSQYPNTASISLNKMNFTKAIYSNVYKQNIFKVNPLTGSGRTFTAGTDEEHLALYTTAEQDLLWVSFDYSGSLNYSLFSTDGDLIFKVGNVVGSPWATDSHYLTQKNQDLYVYYYDHANVTPPQIYWNAPFLDADQWGYPVSNPLRFDVEVRFGTGKKQKAHRLTSAPTIGPVNSWEDLTYQDYVDVPFEVWDVTNNRQLMFAFRDQGQDGKFNLVPPDYFSLPATTQSREYMFIYPITYSTIPDATITASGDHGIGDLYGEFKVYFLWPYLANGATWNENALPASSINITAAQELAPGGKILKVNASGISTVKEEVLNSPVALNRVTKVVPYNNGFAILCNSPTFGYNIPHVFILDENFNQLDVQAMNDKPDEWQQFESNGSRIFYASITTQGANVQNSIQLTTLANGSRKDRYLDEFIQFEIEAYRITPTITGGVALVAWVKPTIDTRDLLFLEFDENLDLVKR